MTAPSVIARNEPSDAAWRRAGDIAARILENLAQRDARAAAANPPTGEIGDAPRGSVETDAPTQAVNAA
ncbi:hypothetical protein [Microbacterium galbinum]|uniref:hypothetical protein n=1 Tax=Microbacterium galbinum TaxID=2851646 RepID=UPI001FFD8AFD|nr:hypothetical protein [Microbacterium galbinum]MCK2031232.1 hypothetical protein [Microbacterium galbinum]